MTDDRKVLTDRQGHPISDNQNLRTIGERGPATLENYHFVEKLSHFDRERIPERVVHARGATAFGEFEAYGGESKLGIGTHEGNRAGRRRPGFSGHQTPIAPGGQANSRRR